MKLTKYLTPLIALVLFGCSQKQRDVPKELFNIELGKIYSLGDGTKNSVGNLPIKKIAGYETSFTIGQHLYFQPLLENKNFEYFEIKKSDSDEHFNTTYRLYLLPILPKSIDNLEELKKIKFDKAEIAIISWSNKLKDSKTAYHWASEMCATFEADIGKPTQHLNNYSLDMYSCDFKKDERILNIYNIGDMVIFELKYEKEFLQGKIDAIDNQVKKLKAKEILN